MPIDSAALVSSTLAMLETQELQKAADILKERLLKHSLCEDDGELKPFVELVLFEIRDISKRAHLSKSDKHDLVRMTLTVAGF